MFQALKLVFQALEHVYQVLELVFQALEHKIPLERKTFSARANFFCAEMQKNPDAPISFPDKSGRCC